MSSSHTNGVSVSYTYDAKNRLSTVVDGRLGSGSNTTTYTYDPANNVATATYPNGLETTFAYDSLNRLTDLTTPVSGYSYGLDSTGKRTSALELSGRSLTWTYDGINRLTNEAITGAGSGHNGTVAYSLDPVGNRLSDTSSLSGVTAGSATFDADDRLSTETYDSNGNTLTTATKSFAYDSENHLVSMNSGAVTIVYDGDGNRVAKTVGGVTTHYLVDDLNQTGYAQVVEEVVSGAVTREYTYGLQRISENQVISSTWTPSFYGYDGGGTVRQLTNTSGTVTDTYDYDAFGNKINSTGTTPNNYLYRGEQFDPDLGMYYLRARYYNPLTGRFLSVDSEAGQGQRRYEYASANPVDSLDPSGNEAIIEFALLQFYPGRLAIRFPGIPSWCGLPIAGKYFPQCIAPPSPPVPPGPPCTGPMCKKYVAVAEDNPRPTILRDWAGRYVDYGIFELVGNSYCCQTHQFTVELRETLLNGDPAGRSICNQPDCSQAGAFEDTQNVKEGSPYSVRRYWSIDFNPIPVWDPLTSSPAPFEILHLKFPGPFIMEYGK